MFRKLLLLFLIISTLCLGESILEIEGAKDSDNTNISNSILIKGKTSLRNIKFYENIYNTKLLSENNFDNLEMSFDNKKLFFCINYNKTFQNNIQIFTKEYTTFIGNYTLIYGDSIIVPKINLVYLENKTYLNDYNYSVVNTYKANTDLLLGYEYKVNNNFSLISNNILKIDKNSIDKIVNENGCKALFSANKLSIIPLLTISNEYNETNNLYLNSNISIIYNLNKRLSFNLENYNSILISGSYSKNTEKISLSSNYNFSKTEFGDEGIQILASHNYKGLFEFQRYQISVNKYINKLECAAYFKYKDSIFKDNIEYGSQLSYHFNKLNMIFIKGMEEKRNSSLEYKMNTLEIGIVTKF